MQFFSQSWNILQVVLGIGLVIFVHEAGHFLFARWCGVRVEVFSLGFGPRLFGWRRGHTQYQVAAVPLGGYVRMYGEEPSRGGELAPDDLRSKTVGQRFLIYSGGVIMNVVFALVIFPIIFTVGVPFEEPRLGEIEPGGAAWIAGLEPGTEISKVNGHRTISYLDILIEVALSPEGVDLEVREPAADGGASTRNVHLVPSYDERDGRYSIGISNRPAVDPDFELFIEPDSPAAKAGLQTGDRLVDVPSDMPEHDLLRRFLEAAVSGEPLTLVVERDGPSGPERREVQVAPTREASGTSRMLGISPVANRVRALREHPLIAALDLRVGDRILSAQGRFVGSGSDFARALTLGEGPLEIQIERDGRVLALTGPDVERATAFALARDVALEHDPESSRVTVLPGTPATAAGLRDGDTILKIDEAMVSGWEEIREHTEDAAQTGRVLDLRVQREGPAGPELVTVRAAPAVIEHPVLGASLARASYLYRSPNFAAAITDGARCSWKFMTDAWMTLKRILRGQVSGKKNIGGIITISAVSYASAQLGFTYLLFFLCMLSVNLAFLNVLPIPILDGGHLFFLLIEKLKGSPVSERVLGYSQMVGLVMIVSLMIYVTFNDVMRWFFPSL